MKDVMSKLKSSEYKARKYANARCFAFRTWDFTHFGLEESFSPTGGSRGETRPLLLLNPVVGAIAFPASWESTDWLRTFPPMARRNVSKMRLDSDDLLESTQTGTWVKSFTFCVLSSWCRVSNRAALVRSWNTVGNNFRIHRTFSSDPSAIWLGSSHRVRPPWPLTE